MNDRIQLAGNLLMFAPIGLVLANLQPVRRTRRVLAWALAASLGIELVQALAQTGRSVDVNDVLLNVTGAALGCAVYDLVRRHAGAPDAARDPA